MTRHGALPEISGEIYARMLWPVTNHAKPCLPRPSFSTAGDKFSQNYIPVNVLLIFFFKSLFSAAAQENSGQT